MNITLSEDDSEIILRAPSFTRVVSLGSCEDAIPLRACYEQYDSTHSSDRPARVSVYRLMPEPKVEISADNRQLTAGQEYDVTITLTNEGDYDIDPAELFQNLPSSFTITHTKGCSADGNAITWQGKLSADDSEGHECEYSFVPSADGTFETTAVVKYNDGYSEKEEYSSTLSFTVSPIFSAEVSLNKSNLNIGDKVRISFTLTNEEEKKATLTEFSVFTPHFFRVVKTSSHFADSSQQGGTVLRWQDDTFTGGESDTAFIDLLATHSGTFSILYKYNYEQNDEQYSKDISALQVKVNSPELEVESSLSNNEQLPSGSFEQFSLWVENPSESYNLTKVTAHVKTDLFFSPEGYIEKVLPGGKRKALDVSFAVPESNTTKSFPLSYNVTAFTEYGEKIFKEGSLTLRVVPRKTLKLSSSFSATRAYSGEEIRIKSSVSNPDAVNYTNIKVKAFIPPTLDVKGATEVSLARIGAGETENVLDFKVSSERVMHEEDFLIIIQMQYEDESGTSIQKQEKTITFLPAKPSLSVSLKASSSSAAAGDFIP
ncbi:hypothetical protein D6764_03940, partial [Candidatus Woesearchaeota archaeon]